MKTRSNGRMKASVLALALLAAPASASWLPMTNSPVNPAAQGEVKVGKADNDNTNVHVRVKHLTPPEKIDPKASAYVVWARPSGQQNRAFNLGALKVDKDLEGGLETVTPFKTFQVFITPEPSSEVVDPAGQPLLWTNVSR